jgi:amino acid adenylation domain-containing protein
MMLLSEFLLQHAVASSSHDAIVQGNERWDYARLSREVRHYQAALRELGLSRGDRVIVQLEAEPAAIAVLVAIVALGAIYVPVAPELPTARFAAVASSIQPFAIVTSRSRNGETLQPFEGGALLVTRTDRASTRDEGRAALGDAAYIIMTSGSTGVPKGIVMTHGSTVASLTGFSAIGVPKETRIGSISPLHFDFAMFDLGLALGNGATLVQVPRLLAHQPRGLTDYLREHRVSRMQSVPSVWRPILASDDPSIVQSLPHLDSIVYAAESFAVKEVLTLQRWRPDWTVYQCFGHSESIGCCFKRLESPARAYRDRLSLGSALNGTELFALNDMGREVVEGEVGELYVRGPHLFCGYWRDEEQTRNRLVLDPRTGRGVVFRSGDLVVRDADGEFYFIGRVDHQVKVGGNRVELSEIELVVEGAPDVASAVVVAVPDDDKITLVCFVVPRDDAALGDLEAQLRRYASTLLPRYMVPRRVRLLPALPLLSNGKIDRMQLTRAATELVSSRGSVSGAPMEDAGT